MGCASAKHVATVQNEEEAQKGKNYQNGDVFGGKYHWTFFSAHPSGAFTFAGVNNCSDDTKLLCGGGGGRRGRSASKRWWDVVKVSADLLHWTLFIIIYT